jgi:hypothetical protein
VSAAPWAIAALISFGLAGRQPADGQCE